MAEQTGPSSTGDDVPAALLHGSPKDVELALLCCELLTEEELAETIGEKHF